MCFITQVQPAADGLIPLLGACSAVLVNLALVFLIVEGRVPCWTPPAPQAVKTLLTSSFVLYRPHLREASVSSGDKQFSPVSGHAFSPRTPASSAECHPWALFVLLENEEAIFPLSLLEGLLQVFQERLRFGWVILTLSQGVVLSLAVLLPVGCSHLSAGPQ